jgi:hypothetical protein
MGCTVQGWWALGGLGRGAEGVGVGRLRFCPNDLNRNGKKSRRVGGGGS